MNLPKKGQILYCRRCDTPLYTLVRDIKEGDPSNDPYLFDSIGEQPKPLMGQIAECHKCGNQLDFYNIK